MTDDGFGLLRGICLGLPEATEIGGQMPSFRVRDKTFVWYCDNHHGDGKLALWLKAAPGEQEMLVAADPVKFFAPPYVGPKGWIGVRLDVDPIDWDEIAELVEASFRLAAPKRLAAQLDGAG